MTDLHAEPGAAPDAVAPRVPDASDPADAHPPRSPVLYVAIGVAALFAASWWLVSWLAARAFYGPLIISDIPVYRDFATAIASGQLPYRDVAIEYPPIALPVFLLPRLLGGASDAGYESAFAALMPALGMATAALVAFAASRFGASRGRVLVAGGLVGLSPVLLGPVMLSRYDLWPALQILTNL